MQLQASNLSDLSQGENPKILLDPKTWDSTLKMIEKLPNLQMLEKVLNGEVLVTEKKESTKEEPTDSESGIKVGTDENPFEARSKAFKAKMNGSSHN